MVSTACPCDGLPEPLTISNLSGLSQIAYRTGDFLSIRAALLQPLPGEQALTQWRPSASGDLALQMVEWWAYLGDILTFYNERSANQAYLRTADQPESVRNLIRLLGYRPRPGIAAQGNVAALISGKGSFTLPRGFSIDSKPGPGEDPQTFELDLDTVVAPNELVAAQPARYLFSPTANQFLIQGASSQVVAGDVLLLADSTKQTMADNPLLTVSAVVVKTLPDNTKRTCVTFTPLGKIPTNASSATFRIQKANQSSAIWTANGSGISDFPKSDSFSLANDPGVNGSNVGFKSGGGSGTVGGGLVTVQLAGLVRSIRPGDPILFISPPNQTLQVASQIRDVVWYLNPDDPDSPQVQPTKAAVPLPVLHTQLALAASDTPLDFDPTSTTAYFGWQDVNSVIDQPADDLSEPSFTLFPVAPAAFRATPNGAMPVLLEDSNGAGALASALKSNDALSVSGLPDPTPQLSPPLNVLYNVLSVSRGKTVPTEILGSGDASVAGQEFVLQKSPLTYLAQGADFVSTLQVRVNGRLWTEASSFYRQAPDAEIFVTAEDETQKTHVTFGDGVNGARLPTGSNNVVSTYRYGSGQAAPSAGQLTVISKPYPNLRAIRSPTDMGGGADADPPEQIKRYAPRSVLTFGRAVSGDDYEVIAAQAPSVTRAKSYWSFSTAEQRAVVKVYVGDDANAVKSASAALASAGDPNRHVEVVAAASLSVGLTMSLIIDPRHLPTDVSQQVQLLLSDPIVGLFGSRRLAIGEPIFDSQIVATCLQAEGCVAVRNLAFTVSGQLDAGPRHVPGEGTFFVLPSNALRPSVEVSDHAG